MTERSNLPRFFADPSLINEDEIYLENRAYHKAKNVLRLKVKDQLIILDNIYNEYTCSITQITKDKISCKISETLHLEPPPLKLILAQSVIKKTGMEILVQKATELGISEIYPIITLRTVIQKANDSQDRLKLIAEEASLQSERPVRPIIHNANPLQEFLDNLPNAAISLLCLERSDNSIKDTFSRIASVKSILIFCGPEGGFEEEEKRLIISKGFIPITLGKNILRAETSAIAAIAIFKYINENF